MFVSSLFHQHEPGAGSELVWLASLLRTGLPFHGLESHHRARSWIRLIFASTAAANTTGLFRVRWHCVVQAACDTKAPRVRGAIQRHKESSAFQSLLRRRCISSEPKHTINNGGRCVAIDFHGCANLHWHPNTPNPPCPCLAAISKMAVKSFCSSCW